MVEKNERIRNDKNGCKQRKGKIKNIRIGDEKRRNEFRKKKKRKLNLK